MDNTKDVATSDDAHERVDPLEFVRAVLHICPEDAAEVRKDAAVKGTRAETHDPSDAPTDGPTRPV